MRKLLLVAALSVGLVCNPLNAFANDQGSRMGNGWFGQVKSYSQGSWFGQPRTYGRSKSYGRSKAHIKSRSSIHGKSYSRSKARVHPKAYGRVQSYGRSSAYTHPKRHGRVHSYGRSSVYTHPKRHGRVHSYGRSKTVIQPKAYIQGKSYDKRRKVKSRRVNQGVFLGNGYIGIEGASLSVAENLDGDLNPRGLRFRAGVPLAQNFDLEGQFGFSGDNASQTYDEFGVNYAAAFLKGYIPLGFNSAIYGLVGFSGVEITQNVNRNEFTDDRFGFSYGAGIETRLTQNLDLTADFTSFVRDEGLFENISALSVGLKLYF